MSKRRIASRASSVTTESSEEYITPDIVPTARKRKKLDAVRTFCWDEGEKCFKSQATLALKIENFIFIYRPQI